MVGDFGKGLLHGTAAGANRIAQQLMPGEQPRMGEVSDWSSSQVPESGAGSAGGFIGEMAPEFTLAGDIADMSRVPGYVAGGELGNAGLSALAAVPFIGTPVAGLLKAGRGTVRATNRGARVAVDDLSDDTVRRILYANDSNGEWEDLTGPELREAFAAFDAEDPVEWSEFLDDPATKLDVPELRTGAPPPSVAEGTPLLADLGGDRSLLLTRNTHPDQGPWRITPISGDTGMSRGQHWAYETYDEAAQALAGSAGDVNPLSATGGLLAATEAAGTAQEVQRATSDMSRSELQVALKEKGLPATGTNDALRELVDVVAKNPQDWTRAEFDRVRPHINVHQDLKGVDLSGEIMEGGLTRGMVDPAGGLDPGASGSSWGGYLRGEPGGAYLFWPGDIRYRGASNPYIEHATPFMHLAPERGEDLYDAIRRVDQGASGGLLADATAPTIGPEVIRDPELRGLLGGLRPGETLPPEVQQALRSDYPAPAPGVPGFNKKKQKPFISRGMDESNQAFKDARDAAQADIDAGNYDPFFPESERYYANPDNYASDAARNTDEALPKRADTIAKKVEEFDTPEIRQSFRDAFKLGSRDPNSSQWYAVGQLEDAAIKHLGVEAGSEWFRKAFAEGMASTTSGQAPTPNLMMAAYSNFRDARGIPVPDTPSVPRPVQGQYMSGNLTAGEKIRQEGFDPANQPKGFNFSRDFMGELDRGTMDKQMTEGALGVGAKLPNNAFAVFENTLRDEASKLGLPTGEMQDVAWAGFKAARDAGMSVAKALKEGVPGAGFPMIRHINEAVERTSRLTGQAPEEVVRRWITENAPLYAVGGLLGVGATQREKR
tara:strand:+ start:687 stop:3185 length:2499 start_codon:yes stop_codon:yes gene_type:complete